MAQINVNTPALNERLEELIKHLNWLKRPNDRFRIMQFQRVINGKQTKFVLVPMGRQEDLIDAFLSQVTRIRPYTWRKMK